MPVLAIALLVLVRALAFTPALDALAVVGSTTEDPPNTTAYSGSIYVTRGGPVIIGFQSPASGRLQFAGRDLHGQGVVKERIIVPHGAHAIRVALPPGGRLVWSPVGRRGDPEYVVASSLSAEPPDRATFDHPGTAPLDGIVAIAILLVIALAALYAMRARLAAVPRAMWIAVGAIFVAGVLVRLFDLAGAGQTWDEDVNWAAGRNYVENLLSLDFRPSSWQWNYEHPPVMKYLAGVGAQLADGFGPARAISAIVVALGCALLVPIGARLYNLRTGILAAAIATLLPSLVAHGKVVGHEAPTVLWWSLGVLLALGVHDGKPTLRRLYLRLAFVGVVVGVAIASRFVNGLLGPLCALIVVAQAPIERRNRVIVWGAILMPLAAIATLYLVWPRLYAHPIDALSLSFRKLDVVHAPEPFLGAATTHPPGYYFLVYLFATLPFAVLAGVLGWLARGLRDRDRTTLVVLAWLLVPLAVAFSPVRQDGVRYIMPCFAAIAMMAAAALDALGAWLEPRVRHGFTIFAVGLVVFLGVVDVRTHPYYLDYFGAQVGGAGTAARRRWFETAWWGEGLAASLAYVDANAEPNARVARECVEPSHLAWFREDLWTPSGMGDAQWIVVYAPERMRCNLPPDAKRVFAVEHDGTVLSAVYRR